MSFIVLLSRAEAWARRVAREPLGFTWREWLAVMKNAFSHFLSDDCLTYSAAITFYFILSSLPLVMLLLSLGGFLISHFAPRFTGEAALYSKILEYMKDLAPFLRIDMVNKLDVLVSGRGTLGLVGAGALLLASTLALGALEQALRRIFNYRSRHFIIQRLVVGGLVFGAGFALAASTVVTAVLAEIVGNHLPFILDVKKAVASFPVVAFVTPLVLLFVAFVIVVKYFLGRKIGWGTTFFGGGLFVVMFVVARLLYSVYLSSLANLNALYGSLTALVVLVLWVFYVCNVFLFSAEVMKIIDAPEEDAADSESA